MKSQKKLTIRKRSISSRMPQATPVTLASPTDGGGATTIDMTVFM